MVKLSEFTDKTIAVEAKVRGETVKLTVRPYRWTVDAEARFMDDNQSRDSERARDSIIAFFLSVVDGWDLIDDDGSSAVPLTSDRLRAFPTVLLAELLEEAKTAITFRKSR